MLFLSKFLAQIVKQGHDKNPLSDQCPTPKFKFFTVPYSDNLLRQTSLTSNSKRKSPFPNKSGKHQKISSLTRYYSHNKTSTQYGALVKILFPRLVWVVIENPPSQTCVSTTKKYHTRQNMIFTTNFFIQSGALVTISFARLVWLVIDQSVSH